MHKIYHKKNILKYLHQFNRSNQSYLYTVTFKNNTLPLNEYTIIFFIILNL